MNDKQLKQFMSLDNAGKPDEGISDRLNYAFMLKSAQYETKKNSFVGFFAWIFSLKGMAAKSIIAASLLSLMVIKPNLSSKSDAIVSMDTTAVNQSLVLDSTLMESNSLESSDSIF